MLLLKKDIEDSQYRGSRRVFQTLPRHMRRRAASHNIKRLPVRLRQRALEELKKDPQTAPKVLKKPPCRRRRRRPGSIVQEYERRQSEKRWLETHMWHAKRAHMEDHWGYRIAVKVNEKCLKACLRSARHGCFLMDCSYHELVEIKQSPMTIERVKTITGVNVDDEDKKAHASPLIHVRNADGSILGPAVMIVDEYHIRFIVHPLLTLFLVDLLQTKAEDVTVCRGQYSVFRMQGSRVLSTLREILETPQSLAHSFVQGHSRDLRFKGAGDNSEVLAAPSLWDIKKNTENVKRRRPDKELDQIRSKLAIPGSGPMPTLEDPRIPYGLISLSSATKGPWMLVLPKGWGSIVWRALVRAPRVRFGSLTEMKYVETEMGRPIFPDDYPSSSAFAVYSTSVADELERCWLRKPPAKRVNYTKLGVMKPFHLSLDGLSSTSICRLEYVGRGCPEYNARVWLNGIVIGVVTTGIYSQMQGRGVAMATCALPSDVSLPLAVEVLNISGGPKRDAKIVQIYP